MPNADEASVERQTYGNAPGWSGREKEAPPEGAPGDSPTPDAPAPSAEPAQAPSTEEGTPPSTQPEPEKKWNQPPQERWEELRQQRLQAEERAAKAEQLAQLALQKLQTPTTVPPDDAWKGLVDHADPATAQFYQQQRALFQKEAERMADYKVQGVLQAVEAGRRELAEIKIAQFRSQNPDIKPGSQDEAAIAGYVQQGYPLENAKKLALFDRLESENRALKTKQASVPTKRAAANAEPSSGIPAGSGLPAKQGDWRDKVSETLDGGGSFRDAVNAAFGIRR